VTASATAGPSGVSDIECSVDGSPYAVYPGASAQIPVSAIGAHTVSCFAQNNAYDSSLTRASSALGSWHLSIRQPTVSAITFGTRLLDALRCHRATIRLHVPARWVTVRRYGKPVRVHRRAGTRVTRVSRCHPRVVIRKVKVRGRVRRRRVVLLPHTIQITIKHIRFRQTATIGGWTGLANGTALANAPVQVITATDNGRGHWRVATATNTNANGFWQAKLRPGPSRLIAAVYPGSSTTELSTSGQLRLISRTKLSLRIRPQIAQWGHTIQITGRVLGGNIPAGKLLRLRIGAAGLSAIRLIVEHDQPAVLHSMQRERALLGALESGGNHGSVLDLLGRECDFPVSLFTQGAVFTPRGQARACQSEISAVQEQRSRNTEIIVLPDGAEACIFDVYRSGHGARTQAQLLCQVPAGEISTERRVIIDQTLAFLAVELRLRSSARALRRAPGHEFLLRAMGGEASTDELDAWTRALGVEPVGHIVCFVVQSSQASDDDVDRIAEALEDMADALRIPRIVSTNDREASVFVFVREERETEAALSCAQLLLRADSSTVSLRSERARLSPRTWQT